MKDMKKSIISLLFLFCVLPVNYVPLEQKYMPDGYVRDEYIRPYFVHYVSEYFKKVDSGQIECRYKTYRQQVEKPLSRDTERIYMKAIEGLYPRD